MRDVHTAERQNNLVEIQRRLCRASKLGDEKLAKIHEACRKQRAVAVRDTGSDPGASQKESMTSEILEQRKHRVGIQYDYETWSGPARTSSEVAERALSAFRAVIDEECMPEFSGDCRDPSVSDEPQMEFTDRLTDFLGDVEKLMYDEMPWGCREEE